MNTLQTLLDRLETSALSEEDKQLARSVAADFAILMARQAAGEDLEAEFHHIKAQAANMTAGAAAQVAAEIRLWATQLVTAAVAAAL